MLSWAIDLKQLSQIMWLDCVSTSQQFKLSVITEKKHVCNFTEHDRDTVLARKGAYCTQA